MDNPPILDYQFLPSGNFSIIRQDSLSEDQDITFITLDLAEPSLISQIFFYTPDKISNNDILSCEVFAFDSSDVIYTAGLQKLNCSMCRRPLNQNMKLDG
ncbi:MAG: hypothetical protein EZS28_007261 [Streblomastix strix]|uniref:Uncharacterized protein n=1 Tax=Streblomastix strix TaxID=222440 RepID=A0A5J4WR07_9EUKA|nr:MAG: hypothetical protein EZS28_007261 [Streblomastix strix]